MTINWENIKYLFQLPLQWFKSINDKIFNAYGTNFIVVKDGDDGGMQIDVDEDTFASMVRNIAGDGTVKSVDNIAPDISGNVELSAVRMIDGQGPDSNGRIELSVVKSVNNQLPDAAGAVSVDVGVLTINNTAPDANGNINIDADTSQCLQLSDWMNANSNHSVSPYIYSNTAYNGNLPAGVTNLYTWTGALTYNSLDDEITDLGYVKDEDLGDLAYLDSVTIDGHESDENGEVSFGLAASKWVKTDASGHLATTNETPIAIDTSQYTPRSGTGTVITAVTWDGTNLKYSSQDWTFQNGVLVNVKANSDTTIDTPVVITWS